MTTIFEKLNLKDQSEILVLNAPKSFEPALGALEAVRILRRVESVKELNFALAFVTRQQELDELSKALAERSPGDALLWFAYPKGTSKRYSCDFSRDKGWDVIRAAGFDSVRQIAIDEDWSALRFRRIEFIHQRSR